MGTFSMKYPWVRTKTTDTPQIAKQQAEESQLSIYLAGKRTMDERNRRVQTQNKRLWGAFFGMGGILAVSTMANLHYSGRSQFIPYIIQTDRTGRVLNAQVLEPSQAQQTSAYQALVSRELSSWVEDLRTVTTDPYAQQTLANRVYSRLDENGDAKKVVSDWYMANDPIERGKKYRVEVTVLSDPLPESAGVYEVYWKETQTSLADGERTVSHWRAVFTIAVHFSKKNPMIPNANKDGVFVEHMTTPTPDKDSSHD